MLENSSKQTVSRWDLEGLSGLIVFFHSGLPLGRRFPIPLWFWMNEHSSVFASDCESQGKWRSTDNLETLFAEETVFTRLGFTPLVDWFASRLITQCWKFISPCPVTSPNCVGRAVFKPNWPIFPSIYAFPPPLLLPCILEKSDLYPGRGILFAL